MTRVAWLSVLVLAACGTKTGLDLEPACESDDDCPSADFCGDVHVCRFHACVSDGPRDCRDANECTVDACDGAGRACTHVPRDRDGDGHGDHACGGDDCDDLDPTTHPGARELCTGGRDEDCDGHYDCSDPDCAADPACIGCTPESCSNGRDDDCDALVDCADMDCTGDPACCTASETRCADGRDDDCDGTVDCRDTDCARDPACCVATPETCDGMDQDCDGVPDDGVRCYFVNGTRVAPTVTPVCGVDWYAYGSPSSASANPVPDVRMSSAVALVVQEGPCGSALAVIADQVDDGSGGSLTGSFAIMGGTTSPVLVSDDPGECRSSSGGTVVTCDWTWQPCCTDGGMIGPFPGDFCVDATLSAPSGVSRIDAFDGPVRAVPLSFGAPIRVCGLTTPAVP